MNQTALCWIDNQIIPAQSATIPVFDHGLLYGDGIFEGLRFYHGKVFMLQAHLQRLQHSANAISLTLPYSLSQISEIINQLVQAFHEDSGYLRLVVTRGPGSLGIDPDKCSSPNLFIIADELSVVATPSIQQGIKLFIASTRRTPAQCLDPKIKSLNYLNNILARIEANQAGMDEALMLNTQGHISEGSVDNLFIISKGKLFTPQLSDGLLAGITREVILEIALGLGIPTQETSLTPYDLMQADECFLTGTGAELIPVRQVNQHLFAQPETPLYNRIQQAFHDKVAQHCDIAQTA